MPRPKLPRYISSRPDIKGFAPDGVPHNGETILSMEEFEAIRLSDYQGLDQTRASELMNVSRQTFGRILKQARYNLAQALVTGQRLRVKGGCYKMQGSGRRQGRPKGQQITEQNTHGPGRTAQRGPGAGRKKGRGPGKGRGHGGCGRGNE